MTCILLFLEALETQIAPFNCDKLSVIMGNFNLNRIDWFVPFSVKNHTAADAKF